MTFYQTIGVCMLMLAAFHLVAMIMLWPLRKNFGKNYFGGFHAPPPKPVKRKE